MDFGCSVVIYNKCYDNISLKITEYRVLSKFACTLPLAKFSYFAVIVHPFNFRVKLKLTKRREETEKLSALAETLSCPLLFDIAYHILPSPRAMISSHFRCNFSPKTRGIFNSPTPLLYPVLLNISGGMIIMPDYYQYHWKVFMFS